MPLIWKNGQAVEATEDDQIPAPSVRVPVEVSRFQAKAALAAINKLTLADAVVAQASDLAKLAWAEALVFRRDSPTIAALAPALDLDDAALDDLFRTAATISA